MKSRTKNILSIFLSLVVLVSSNGIVVAAHNCFSQHKTEVSLFSKKCCSKEKEQCHSKPAMEDTFAKKCCELKITYHKVDVKAPLVKNASIQHLNLFSNPISFSSPSFFSDNISISSFNKAPPCIRSGVALLHSIGLLQI
jgi:hypothetical protein